MTALSITLALAAVVAAALAVLALAAWRRASLVAARRSEVAERELAELRERLVTLERSSAPRAGRGPDEAREFVITGLGQTSAEDERLPVKVSLTGPAFTDVVVRETLVQTASLVHGLRRALSVEVRHRIRLEMKRELKRSRKARRTEVRQALREFRARQRRDAAGAPPAARREEVA